MTGFPLRSRARRRQQIRDMIFEADTAPGKLYDVVLILTVVLSVVVVMLDSVAAVRSAHGRTLYYVEWFFTILFTVDYIVRLLCVGRPLRYALSFFGLVDLLGILPTYLSLFLTGSHYFVVIRFLRVLRTFRVLKLSSYQGESQILIRALKSSHRRVVVFLLCVLCLVVVLGSLMYVIESHDAGFTSIPRSIYWAIVTLTTVGYGDISPQTPLGQALAAAIMLLGYSIIVVPTGLVSASVVMEASAASDTRRCPACGGADHREGATYCQHCGVRL
jgi:voltage-gated potassium channel